MSQYIQEPILPVTLLAYSKIPVTNKM